MCDLGWGSQGAGKVRHWGPEDLGGAGTGPWIGSMTECAPVEKVLI